MAEKLPEKTFAEMSVEEQTELFEKTFSPYIRYGYAQALVDMQDFIVKKVAELDTDGALDMGAKVTDEIARLIDTKRQVDFDLFKKVNNLNEDGTGKS